MSTQSHPLTIYALKKPTDKKRPFLTKDEFLAEITVGKSRVTIPHREHELKEFDGAEQRLFVRTPFRTRSPEWTDFLSKGLVDPASLNDLKVASASALLVICVAGRQFALTFGHGRHMLNPRAVEERFGIRATLNSIDPQSIASIDKQAFDGMPSLSRIQTSRAATIDDYAMDVESELLRAIVGRAKKEHSEILGKMVAGMDALKIHAPIEIRSLPKLLKYVLDRSESSDYKTRSNEDERGPFDWVDNLFEIRDKDRSDRLLSTVWTRLKSGDFENVWLSIPEILDWDKIRGFAYTNKREMSSDGIESGSVSPREEDLRSESEDTGRVVHHTLDIETFADTFRSDASLSTMSNRKIYVVYDDGSDIPYPANKCLYAEIAARDALCILTAGSWYEVKPSFNSDLDTFVKGISTFSSADYFEYDHDDEAHYSRDVALKSQPNHVVLDQDLVSYKGSRNRVEICDLFGKGTGGAKKDQFVHLKRGKGSSTLSHLFAQAFVSSQLLHHEGDFRAELERKLRGKSSGLSKKPWVSDNYEVVIGVINGAKGTPLKLPFFSKINLRNVCYAVRGWGFEVRLLHVPEAQSVIDARRTNAATKRARKANAGKPKAAKPQAAATRKAKPRALKSSV
jgi:hypothetical protein